MYEGLSEDKRLLIEKHLNLVIKANEVTNITRIDSVEQAKMLHIEDSLAGVQELNAAPDGLYADLGSGAGYPGIPLVIASGRETMLVESVKKKAKILDNFILELGLSDTVSVYPGRAEELASFKPAEFSVITARALSQTGSLMELASPLLVKGGHLICYKARVSEEEFNHALSLENKLGLKLISDRDFYLSDNETYRRILVFEKIHNAQVNLPRRTGMAQRQPL
jgi:16S rRNA (guanine527-N7)-methyltransferase